jgi:hypothetical protein
MRVVGANGRERNYKQTGVVNLPPVADAVVKKMAALEDRSVANILRQLVMESPRLKAALREVKVKL